MKDDLLILFGLIVLGLVGMVWLHGHKVSHPPVQAEMVKVEPEVYVESVKAPETVKEPEVVPGCQK